MTSTVHFVRSLAVAALACAAAASQAAITVYTSQAAFDAAVTAKGTDTYTGFSITGTTATPIIRTAGAYGYTAAAPANFFGGGTPANPFLSTNVATDSITFNAFTGGPSAIGGNFFGSDIDGLFAAGSITLVATDGGGSVTQTITGATTTSFLGFISSNNTLASLVVTSVQPTSGFLWPSVDNLQLAVVAVPEPGVYAMMIAGLGVVGFMARRRRV